MYTVIIADDEEEIRKRIVRKVKWEELGFRVVGEAENGIEALEMIEKMEPDLLLTDIRMPFLSGIELARQVREIRPTVQIAFLSGFDEFSYAQQAIQYNVISYILKPISSNELTEEMRKIKKIIDQKFEKFASESPLQEQMEKSGFLLPLLLDDYQREESEEDMHDLIQGARSCGLVGSNYSDALQYVVMVTSISDGEKERTTRASVNAVDMILKKYVRYVSCYLKGRVVSVLSATSVGFGKYLHIIVEEIVQSVERIMGYSCAIGVSRSVPSLTDCRQCYLEAMNALSYSRTRDGNVYFIADEERAENLNLDLIRSNVGTLEELLRGGTQEELEQFLLKLSKQISLGKMPPALADFLLAQMIAAVFQVVYTIMGDDTVRQLQSRFHLNNYNTVEQVMETYMRYSELCMATKELIVEQRKKSGEVLCDKTLEIIDSRYCDQDLSIVVVSNEIAVSPNYLSALIKKSTGQTFVELLTRKRIEKAKELLIYTSMKVREITEKCGYSDQHYFSYCFKKAMGISPNQYRRENGQADEK